jgi:hypothetical protein
MVKEERSLLRKSGENIKVTDAIRSSVSTLKKIILHEKSKVTVDWRIEIRDAKTEKLRKTIKKQNVITNGGLGIFATALKDLFNAPSKPGAATRYYWYLVLGEGAGVPAATDTGLFTPVAASAKHGTLSSVGAVVTYYVRYLPEDANGHTYTEAGIYDKVDWDAGGGDWDDYTAGTLLNHLMLSPTLTKDATILVDFYITVTFS